MAGGNPLGRERFRAETGIKSTDWRGKYWVRWADAIKEAGFQPNLFQSAIPDDDLLSSLAALVRAPGHFQVWAEIRMKTYTTPGFPHHNTFGRFGGIRAIAARSTKRPTGPSSPRRPALFTPGRTVRRPNAYWLPTQPSIGRTVFARPPQGHATQSRVGSGDSVGLDPDSSRRTQGLERGP